MPPILHETPSPFLRIPLSEIAKRPLGADENPRGEHAEVPLHGGEMRPAERAKRRGGVHAAKRHETPALDEAKPEHFADGALRVRRAQRVDVFLEAADERHL